MFTFTAVFQFCVRTSCVICLQFLGKAKGDAVNDGQLRRSTRIQEIEAKKEIELRSLQNKENSVTPTNTKCAHRSRSKSVASERPQNRRTSVDVNSSKTPPNRGRRCDNRSQSTTSDRNIDVSSVEPVRRSMFGYGTASSSPKRYFMAKRGRRFNHGGHPDMLLPTNGSVKAPAKPANRCVNRSKSVSSDQAPHSSSPQQADQSMTLNAPAKSNLKSAHRLIRSKSVSFDQPPHTPQQAVAIIHGPIDLSVKSPAPHQPIAVPNAVGTSSPNVQSPKPSDRLASDMQLSYENRIDNLVQSNFAKINRIKALMAENRSWREQFDALNRINQSLVATVDALNAQTDPSVSEVAIEKAKYEHEIESLRDRIHRLNRENFNLRSTIERLKSSLATHSTQISGEHNYNL